MEVTQIERDVCIPDSWWVVEGDGRTRRQMANSSTGGGTSSLKYKKRRGEGGIMFEIKHDKEIYTVDTTTHSTFVFGQMLARSSVHYQ